MIMVRLQPLHQAHRQAQALPLLQSALTSNNTVAAGNGLLDPSELHAVLSVSPEAVHLKVLHAYDWECKTQQCQPAGAG